MANCENCYHSNCCKNYEPRATWACTEYKDNSLIIELPCEVGDTVYYIDSVRNENGKLVDTIHQQKVKQISTNSHGTFLVVDYCNTLNCEDVGITIFFKRKDAEKELERRETT